MFAHLDIKFKIKHSLSLCHCIISSICDSASLAILQKNNHKNKTNPATVEAPGHAAGCGNVAAPGQLAVVMLLHCLRMHGAV